MDDSDGYEHVHMWRFTAFSLEYDGAHSEYVCDLCNDTLEIGPGQPHPLEA